MVLVGTKDAFPQRWQREDKAKALEAKGYLIRRWVAHDKMGFAWFCFEVMATPVEAECLRHGCEPSFGGHKDNCRSFSIYLKSR